MPLLNWIWGKLVAFYRWRQKRRKLIMERRKRIGPVRDWIETIVSVGIMVFVIRVTVVEAFRIPTASMEDTLLVGDFLLVNKFVYGIRTPDWVGIPFTKIGFSVPFTRLPAFKKPQPGDIIVFRYPKDTRVNYIKRCIATSGQAVEIKSKKVFVDGKLFTDRYGIKYDPSFMMPPELVESEIYPEGAGNRDNYGPVTVPKNCLFMMGDNRDNSLDSRYWGFLSMKNVVGKAYRIYFSWDKKMPFYRLLNKVRWGRIGQLIR